MTLIERIIYDWYLMEPVESFSISKNLEIDICGNFCFYKDDIKIYYKCLPDNKYGDIAFAFYHASFGIHLCQVYKYDEKLSNKTKDIINHFNIKQGK